MGLSITRIALLGLVLAVGETALAEGGGTTERLFGGTTLAGWEGNLKMFRIQQGAIVGGNLKEPIPRNEFLCTTRSFTNFVLRVECKLIGPPYANGGIQFRSQRVANSSEVSGYQADMSNGANGGAWGMLYDEARRKRAIATPSKTPVKAGEWNLYEIRCEGPRIRLSLNGIAVTDYTEKDENIPGNGIIGLQIHLGGPAEAWYRNITIEELP
jgi:hypothetical protein